MTNFSIEQGATLQYDLQVLDANDQPIDVTNWVVVMIFKRSLEDADNQAVLRLDTVAGDVTFPDAINGRITVKGVPTKTNVPVAGEHLRTQYAIRAKDPVTNDVWPLARGIATFERSVLNAI